MKIEEEKFVTVICFNQFHGQKIFKIGSILKLIKEPDNNHDAEAIRVEMRFAGKVGYLANSTKTVVRGTMSGGRVYDKLDDENAYAIVKFISHHNVIAKIIEEDELKELKKDPESDVNFI
ncbi:HIRAN domain-containing protein [uncultured Methanobrevibacter sp.]|uniref:HIRAN domain-containing protein n=1 Tax=uncultured Methanobrevibacter sp. TaxID=253161 RepID=UPI0025CD7773|nr:HIRAN domain-containing protein [uncultured Methanobrevibacter sp.]